MSSGKLRSLDEDDAMVQGGKLRGKRTARGATPDDAHVSFDRLHDGLERESLTRRFKIIRASA